MPCRAGAALSSLGREGAYQVVAAQEHFQGDLQVLNEGESIKKAEAERKMQQEEKDMELKVRMPGRAALVSRVLMRADGAAACRRQSLTLSPPCSTTCSTRTRSMPSSRICRG